MTASVIAGAPAAQAAPGGKHLAPQVEKPDNDGGEVRTRAWPYAPQKQVPAPTPKWPAAGSAEVALPGSARTGAVRVGELPVSLERVPGQTEQQPLPVSVELLDRKKLPVGLRDGLVFRLATRAGSAAVPLRLTADYSDFRWAFGAEWASRLKLWILPECTLSGRESAGCTTQLLWSHNNASSGTVTAEVPIEAAQASADGASGGTLVALLAGASGPGGDFGATSLSPSATWSAGGNAGGFAWQYPIRVPPGIAGPTPSISLSYSSASVDGRSEVTNNQPSWLGEGFEFWPGYIERRYVPCSDDMSGTANNGSKTGDMCWRSDNATMSLNGQGGELIFESGKRWRARNENGWKVEKETGAANGDDNGEYWKVTGTDGTQYFFGRHSLPGQTSSTNSTWTMPVAGNHTDEPCNESSFTSSFCSQAWRWNLDYVVDVRGNTISYWYATESNKYARNNTDSDDVEYIRGGTLTRIDYGTWDRGASDQSTAAKMQVLFTTADRCLTTSCGTHDATNWPDTPWDQECTGDLCEGKYSPTFWSTKRLSKITTQVWDTTKATPDWQQVDSWTFTHSFPPPGDGSDHAGLWLQEIVHAGHVGGTVTMPPVTFTPVSLPNRVLTMNSTTSNWQRIDYIITESGAKIDLDWALPECSASNLPTAAHTNTKRCYPVLVIDPDDPAGEALEEEWWHKHVVRSVSESDLPTDSTGYQAPPKFTYYEYVGTPAWHYADDDGLTKPNRKTWNQFRGYATVKTRVGDIAGSQTLTVTNYLRGMHGDRLSPTGGTRTVSVPASIGDPVNDEDQFSGMVREQVVYNGEETKPVSKEVSVPWMSPALATRTINGDIVTARFTNTKVAYAATALGTDGADGWRITRTESEFDGTYGTANWIRSDGDTGKTGDEKCTTYTYNRNLDKNLTAAVKQTTTTALTCGTPPTSTDHIISDTRNYYDLATSVDTAPTYGAVTKVESLKDWTQTNGTVWQTVSQSTFDSYGRGTSVTDIKGNVVNTTYTPATGGPVTRVTTTRPLPFNWTNHTDANPYWGSAVKTTDQNGGVTEVKYDAIGRVHRVWKLGWAYTGHENSPSAGFTYTFAPNRDAYPYVTSRVMHAAGGYLTSYQILDSLLRPRQTQTAGVGGGRIVADTLYDRWGRASTSYSAHVEPGDPSGALWWEPEWSVPAVNKTVFDHANRPTASIFLASDGVTNLVEKWRTTTVYEGSLTKVTPPDGGTPTTTVTDAQGRTTELRQHHTASGVDGAYYSTWYTYNGKDQLVKVADHAGNEWINKYDVKGRQYEAKDPDKGTTTSEYNDFNELVKTTDAQGEVLWYNYDALGRKTELRDDSSTGPLRAVWKYDRLYSGSTLNAKGQLTEAYRYEPAGSTNVYKWQVRNFNKRYQPGGVNYVIPAVEGSGLAATWLAGYSYSPYDGSPTSVTYPSGGGLATESVTTQYDAVTGLPVELETSKLNVFNYVAAQHYTAYGEPSITMRKTAGGNYVDELTYYEEDTRRVSRTAIQPETATGTVSDRNYDYDDAGNIISIGDTPQVGAADKQCFRYDPLRRLTSAWTPDTTADCETGPTTVQDLAGPEPYWLDWTVDPVGNRTQEVSHTPAGDITREFTLPTGGAGVVRPHAVTAVTTKVTAQPDVTHNYRYDDAGNMDCRPVGDPANACPPDGNSQKLTWDAEGRLDKVEVGGSQVEKNVYGPDGTRWIRRDTTGTTLYLPGQEIRRDNSSVVTGTRYYSFNGRPVGMRTPSGLTWLFTDHQGTQHTAIDALYQQVQVRRQLPYGQPRDPNVTSPNWPNQKGFVGGDNDATGLTHIGARQYDPGLGRFISVDPIMDLSSPQQMHGYSYANNNPITFSDPTGTRPIGDNEGEIVATPDGNGGYDVDDNRSDSTKDHHNGRTRNGPTDYEIEAARKIKHRSVTDVIIQAGGQLLIDLFGIQDILDCIGGDLMACGMALIGSLPATKALAIMSKADRIIDTLKGAIRGFMSWRKQSKWADDVLARADDACPIPGHSFAAGTRVLMADGSTKPIEKVQVGDRVAATDPETGRTTTREVTDLHRNEDPELTDVTVTVDPDPKIAGDETRTVIHTTPNHPFWNDTTREWVGAGELEEGDRLLDYNGDTVTVTVAETITHTRWMYDLTIADIHTYYVIAGDTPVLVHNCGGLKGVWNRLAGKQCSCKVDNFLENNATVGDLRSLEPGNPLESSKEVFGGYSDEDLLEAVRRPSDGGSVAQLSLAGRGSRVLGNGNHRAAELLRRAADPSSSITYDTPIPIWFFGS